MDDEDLSVTQVDKTPPSRDALELEARDVVPELGDEKSIYRRLSGGPKRAPPLSMLHKQDSMASVTSSCSIESDWSDEEKEKLIRAFDDIQERSSATEKNEVRRLRFPSFYSRYSFCSLVYFTMYVNNMNSSCAIHKKIPLFIVSSPRFPRSVAKWACGVSTSSARERPAL